MAKTVTVESITNPKVDGEYRLPGTVWECSKNLAGELAEIGAVEIVPKAPKAKEEPVESLKVERSAAGGDEGGKSSGAE